MIGKVGEVGMSNWENVSFASQGWQCPICGAIYSPMTMACMNCTGWKISNMTSTTDSTLMYRGKELICCKDCKHWENTYGTYGKCKICHSISSSGGWFCADGEREEE